MTVGRERTVLGAVWDEATDEPLLATVDIQFDTADPGRETEPIDRRV